MRWLAATLFVAGCGGLHSPPDFRTDLGVSFYETRPYQGWVTKTDADEVEAMLVRSLTDISWKWDNAQIHGCLARAQVHLVPHPACPAGRDCNGIERGDRIEIVGADPSAPCFQASAYAHELVHQLQGCLFQDPDAAHTNAPAWAAVDQSETTWKDLCTKGEH